LKHKLKLEFLNFQRYDFPRKKNGVNGLDINLASVPKPVEVVKY